MATPIGNSNGVTEYLEPYKSLVSLFVFSKNMDKDYLNMNKKTIS